VILYVYRLLVVDILVSLFSVSLAVGIIVYLLLRSVRNG